MWLSSLGLNVLPILILYGLDHNIVIYKNDYSLHLIKCFSKVKREKKYLTLLFCTVELRYRSKKSL